MADDDSRRGVSNMAEADSSEITDNSENITAKSSDPIPTETECVVVTSQSTDELPTDKPTNCSEEDATKSSADGITISNRDSEETRNRLAKAREELNRAREESARARDEVEKAKKDLAVAKQDTAQKLVEKTEQQGEVSAAALISVQENGMGNEPKCENVEVPDASEKTSDGANATTDAECEQKSKTEDAVVSSKVEDITPSPVAEPKDVEISKKEENTTQIPTSEEATTIDKENEPIVQSSVEENVGTNESCEIQTTLIEKPHEKVDEINKEEKQEGEVLEESMEGQEEGEEEEEDDEEEEEGEEEQEDVELEGEREEGDGEESGDESPAKPLDDDEDRRNPQYIPKRGGFYEHDDRTREEGEEATPIEEPEVEEKPKKNRSEAIDRWGHDMFDESQQGPKSDKELVDMYGYDIRQEEGAPRARRRRRYGRGPNKYDRTWEDEEAYSRPRGRGGVMPRGGGPSGRIAVTDRPNFRPRPQRQEVPRKEEFPALPGQQQEFKTQVESNSRQNAGKSWRENESGSGGNDRRGGGSSKANAISFRRGGGGRTFEEPNKTKGTKNRSDNLSNPNETNEETTGDMPKERSKSPRRGVDSSSRGAGPRNTRGGSNFPGFSRGAMGPSRGRGIPSSRGRRNTDNVNWSKDDEGGNSRGVSQQAFHRGAAGPQGVHVEHRLPAEEHRGRGRSKFGRPTDGNAEQVLGSGMEQMRIEDSSVPLSSVPRNQDGGRSKRYSSQRQRMTTPPPANTGAPLQQPPYPVSAGGTTAYYASYNDSPPPNYVSAAPAPMIPMAVAAQAAPPAYIPQPMYPGGPGPTFNAGPYQGYSPAAAPPAVSVGVPIGSPTQDNMYGGGIMYYDPGRQPIRHGPQPTRRAKAAIPIVAPGNDVDSYLMSGRRPNHE